MQALFRLARQARQGLRSFATDAAETQESRWRKYAKPLELPTGEELKKEMRKEYWGLILLGPPGVAFMIYDLIYGLENHEFHPIPPYPWMRLRAVSGMPWGEDSLFEFKRWVAEEWPLPEGHGTHDAHE